MDHQDYIIFFNEGIPVQDIYQGTAGREQRLLRSKTAVGRYLFLEGYILLIAQWGNVPG